MELNQQIKRKVARRRKVDPEFLNQRKFYRKPNGELIVLRNGDAMKYIHDTGEWIKPVPPEEYTPAMKVLYDKPKKG